MKGLLSLCWDTIKALTRRSLCAGMSVVIFTKPPESENVWIIGGYTGYADALNDTYTDFIVWGQNEGGKRESMWVMVYLRILFLAKVQINEP